MRFQSFQLFQAPSLILPRDAGVERGGVEPLKQLELLDRV
jgi:hypothetical protein